MGHNCYISSDFILIFQSLEDCSAAAECDLKVCFLKKAVPSECILTAFKGLMFKFSMICIEVIEINC